MDDEPWHLELADKLDVDPWRPFIAGCFGSFVSIVDDRLHHPPSDPLTGLRFARKMWNVIFRSVRCMQHNDPKTIEYTIRCMSQALVDYLSLFYEVDHAFVCHGLIHPSPKPLPASLWNLFQARWFRSEFADHMRSYRARARQCSRDYRQAVKAFGVDQLRESLTNRPDYGGGQAWGHFLTLLQRFLAQEPLLSQGTQINLEYV
ncbi:hypothetical protein CALVIDRAFT_565092 [Calocera viscosa TUFC12733]|uniref:Uncharacterized protein n=1 Tax=Calocera viscosa (strain TUFC12733) TaxID=1330018 RepID=A0A167KT35_CALVF|nr:hypothetical protein CALVIDRAFT_565092 [Calocera viscosa TUFC12733]